MNRFMKQALAGGAGLLLAASLQAQAKDFFASAGEPHGVVRTEVMQSAKQIFPVRIVSINGRQTSTDHRGTVWLKPGEHTLTLRGSMDKARTPGIKRNVGRGGGTSTLEITIEEGNTYYVGGKRNSDTDNRWTPVVWKVETSSTAGR